MEEGPAAVAAALGIAGGEVVEISLEQPPEEALAAGLPRLHDAVSAAAGVPLALLGECTLAPAVTAGPAGRCTPISCWCGSTRTAT